MKKEKGREKRKDCNKPKKKKKDKETKGTTWSI